MGNTFCELCQMHKCLVSTVGAAWGESQCFSSVELSAGRPSVWFHAQHLQRALVWGDRRGSLGSKEFSKILL